MANERVKTERRAVKRAENQDAFHAGRINGAPSLVQRAEAVFDKYRARLLAAGDTPAAKRSAQKVINKLIEESDSISSEGHTS